MRTRRWRRTSPLPRAAFRDLGYPYWTARVQLDRAEWLARHEQRNEAAGLAAEAAAAFDAIGAAPMLTRAVAILEHEMTPSASGVELQVSG